MKSKEMKIIIDCVNEWMNKRNEGNNEKYNVNKHKDLNGWMAGWLMTNEYIYILSKSTIYWFK